MQTIEKTGVRSHEVMTVLVSYGSARVLRAVSMEGLSLHLARSGSSHPSCRLQPLTVKTTVYTKPAAMLRAAFTLLKEVYVLI